MSNVSKFNVLGEEINVKDSAARNLIANLTNVVNGKKDKLTEVVWIGDSWSIGHITPSTQFPTNVAKITCEYLGLNLHNYAVGGAGYAVNGNTFYSQAERAAADTTYDHNRVKYVIVLGGFNDMQLRIDARTEASVLFRYLQENFPSAEIHQFVNMPIYTPIELSWKFNSFALYDKLDIDIKRVMHPEIAYVFIGRKDLFLNDNAHPNLDGHYYLAKQMFSLINGGGIDDTFSYMALESNANWDNSHLYVIKNHNKVRIQGFSTCLAATAAVGNICAIPQFYTFRALNEYAVLPSKTGYGSCVVEIQPPVCLDAGTDGFIKLYSDLGQTINAGDNVLIDLSFDIF